MLSQLSSGISGLFLFVAGWLSPATDEFSLHFEKPQQGVSAWQCDFELQGSFDPRLSDIIDAGIPLIVDVTVKQQSNRTVHLVRVLQYDAVKMTYAYSDTLSGKKVHSESYNFINTALRDFRKFHVEFPKSETLTALTGEMVILPSLVPRLGRKVDLQVLFGGNRIVGQYPEVSR